MLGGGKRCCTDAIRTGAEGAPDQKSPVEGDSNKDHPLQDESEGMKRGAKKAGRFTPVAVGRGKRAKTQSGMPSGKSGVVRETHKKKRVFDTGEYDMEIKGGGPRGSVSLTAENAGRLGQKSAIGKGGHPRVNALKKPIGERGVVGEPRTEGDGGARPETQRFWMGLRRERSTGEQTGKRRVGGEWD